MEKAEWCSIEEVFDAYLDCRKRKRSSRSCSEFERNELSNIYNLWKELNDYTYTIGKSDAFCVTRPKVREVFAAQFRDRIVHHLLINKLIAVFENYFIDDTYNCRKGKGTDYGVRRILNYSNQFKDGWVLKCDISGFFMSIHKPTLANMLEAFINQYYNGLDKEQLIWLARMIALNSPEKNCIKKGNLRLWELLPDNKSLFTNGDNYGIAIGNLTSQIFANFYLSDFDHFINDLPNVGYGRYVDDFCIFAKDKDTLLSLLPIIRSKLLDKGLKLHPYKIYLQPVRHGLTFIGSTLKGGRMYAGNHTVSNMTNMIRFFNGINEKEYNIDNFTQRYNSYSGYLIHRATYAIRYNMWNNVSEETKKYILCRNMKSIAVRTKFKRRTKLLKTYGKKRSFKRRVGRNSSILQSRR